MPPVPEGAPAEGAATEPDPPPLEAPNCDDPPDCKLDGTITTSLTELAEAKFVALFRKLSWMSDGLYRSGFLKKDQITPQIHIRKVEEQTA